jgi:hypothetical protein
MSLKERREAQLELYENATRVEVGPEVAAVHAEQKARRAVVRGKYSAEIARLTEKIMGYLDDAARHGELGVHITIGFSWAELDRQRLDPERVGFRRMWGVIINDLRSSDYVVGAGGRGGVQFIDDKEVPPWEGTPDGSPSHYYIKLR